MNCCVHKCSENAFFLNLLLVFDRFKFMKEKNLHIYFFTNELVCILECCNYEILVNKLFYIYFKLHCKFSKNKNA